MTDTSYSMTHPDLQGIDPPPPPRVRGQPRASARRRVTVHWLDANGKVTCTKRESIPHHLLIGETAEITRNVDEIWWWPCGKITAKPSRITQGDSQ